MEEGLVGEEDVHPLLKYDSWNCKDTVNFLKQIMPRGSSEVLKEFWAFVIFEKFSDGWVFTQDEALFFKKLLENDGVLKRQEVVDFIRSKYKIDRISSDLDEMGFIDFVRVGKISVYVLDFELLDEFKNSRYGRVLE